MPHKHTRRRSTSPTAYDLPPTSLARPLPTYTSKTTKPKPLSKPTNSTKATKATESARPTNPPKPPRSHPPPTPAPPTSYPLHDTPRAFTLLHHPRPPPRLCLDDGPLPPSKKRKLHSLSTPPSPTATAPPPSATAPPPPKPQQLESQHAEKPHILPGESLSSFSARVDAALPVRGLTAKGKGIKGQGRQTRMERKLQGMQRSWRGEKERRRGRREEMMEEADGDESGDVDVGGGKMGRKKRGKERGTEEEGDVWAGIGGKALREEGGRGGGLVGLHDVVSAPPKFRGVGGGGKVGGVGKGKGVGLKRQGELGEAKRRVVEGYRALMRERGREGEGGGGGGVRCD